MARRGKADQDQANAAPTAEAETQAVATPGDQPAPALTDASGGPGDTIAPAQNALAATSEAPAIAVALPTASAGPLLSVEADGAKPDERQVLERAVAAIGSQKMPIISPAMSVRFMSPDMIAPACRRFHVMDPVTLDGVDYGIGALIDVTADIHADLYKANVLPPWEEGAEFEPDDQP